MKISYRWLKRYLQVDLSPERVAEILTDTGLEVEGVEEVELDPNQMPDIYIKNLLKVENKDDIDMVLKLFKNKWLFMVNEDELDFKGMIVNDNIEWLEDPPEELIKLLGLDD